MKNFKLTLEFDGTDFFGWQKQPEVRTVQGVLEEAGESLFGEKIKVTGCGRTDAGVHAWEYVCNFHANTGILPEKVGAALSARLPEDVIIKNVEGVSPEFHARYDAVARRYAYTFSAKETAINRRVCYRTKYKVDLDLMKRAASSLLGPHDFTSFSAAGAGDDVSPLCDVRHARFSEQSEIMKFDIQADRFLHHMVRNIMGTLIEVGRGKITPEQISTILCKKDRTAAGPTVPACGLALIGVYYRER